MVDTEGREKIPPSVDAVEKFIDILIIAPSHIIYLESLATFRLYSLSLFCSFSRVPNNSSED